MENQEVVIEEEEKKISKLDKFFKVSYNASSIKKELLAGLITFLAMSYILTVNPSNILFAYGPQNPAPISVTWASIFMATALGAVIGTLMMALFAKMPLAQAPGMGLNFTVGSALLGGFGSIMFSFGQAMLLVLISGIVFLLLSVVPCKKDKETGRLIALRELIFDGMPVAIRKAITVGIGLFIAFIGLKNSGIVVANQGTLVALAPFNDPNSWALGGVCCSAIVCLFGFLVIVVLSHFEIKGSIIIGIAAATLLAIPLQVAHIDTLFGPDAKWAFWNNFADFFSFSDESAFFAVFTQGFTGWEPSMIPTAIALVVTFSMIDMFDTMGTVVGCTTQADLNDTNGKPLNYNKIMISDSVATAAGAMLGTSSVTTFVESASGIAAGGKTGLTALTTAVLFFLSIFILPIFEFIPLAACAPALIYVGVLMMKNVVDIDFVNIRYAVPAFITIVIMPLTYSITNGIGLGVITFVIINGISWIVDMIRFKKGKIDLAPKNEITIVLLVVFVLFLLYFLLPTAF